MYHTNRVFWNSFIFALYFKSIFAHVSLTFPKSRNYDLDFLDNVRTKPPCGMPRGLHGTSIMAGVQLNISWHLAYPHRGGYRLELLDKNDNFLMDLIKRDKSQDYIQGDPTAQWHTITIPKDLLCETCTIRLLRQASEWSNDYRFWSCADVRIVQPSTYIEDCSRHGQVILVGGGDGCKCYKGWWGPRCQYEEECHSNVDCGKGSCVDLGGTSLPRKQCFCPPGLHGMKCSRTNAAKLATRTSLDLSSHTKKKLSDKMTLHYKTISAPRKEDNEMEFVLVMNGTSYGALGWRPVGFNKSCQRFPKIEENKNLKRLIRQSSNSREKLVYKPNQTLLRPLNELQRSRPDPNDNQAKIRQKDQSSYSGKNNRNYGTENTPKYSTGSKVQSKPEPTAEVEPHSEPESSSEPEVEPETSKSRTNRNRETSQSGSRVKPEPEPEGEPETSSEPESSSEPEVEPENPSKANEITKYGTHKSREQAGSRVTPESEPESEPEAESGTQLQSTPSKSWLKGPIPESEPENHNDKHTQSEPEPESHNDKHAQSEPEPEHSNDKHAQSEPEPQSHKDKHSQPEPEPESNQDKHSHAEPEPENHHDKYGHAEPEPESNSKSTSRKFPYAPKGDFHAMDCTDIIIGAARLGVYSRILDYYTRDRSTPRLDEYWNQHQSQGQNQGSNSITSATGWQTEDGMTVLIFRRRIKSSEPTDHDIEGGLHFIWARGQPSERSQYVHSPHSGLEKESPSIPSFYLEDEIKYHGHKDQRGSTFIQF